MSDEVGNKRSARKYPFRTMKVGECVFIPDAPKDFANYASKAGGMCGRLFHVRPVPGGKKLWRLE